MARASGEIIETPVTESLLEGLDIHQYLISTHGSRKTLFDTAMKARDAGYLTRRLADVTQDVIVTKTDCGTRNGIEVEAIVASEGVLEPLSDRIADRVAAEGITDSWGETVIAPGQEASEAQAAAAEDAGWEAVRVRSVLTCETERGVCRLCYGRNLATGRLVERGETVGITAAESIGEPGTQLTFRTHRRGGTATHITQESRSTAKSDGRALHLGINAVRDGSGTLVAVNGGGTVAVVDEAARERERYPMARGAMLLVADGEKVARSQVLLEWDPSRFPVLAEETGLCHFADFEEGVTLHKRVDDESGRSHWVVTDAPPEKFGPYVEIRNGHGETVREHLVPASAHLTVADGDWIQLGRILAAIPRKTTRSTDITGGLQRVVELFGARRPSAPAVISEIDGVVEYVRRYKGYRTIKVAAAAMSLWPHAYRRSPPVRTYRIRQGVQINLRHGGFAKAGEALTAGRRDPHDVLRVLGETELQRHLISKFQAAHRMEGVRVHDKHFEVIVRQMTRWVQVDRVRDTEFVFGQVVDKFTFHSANHAFEWEGGKPATGTQLLLGITKASLSAESFLSAASFQSTTTVLAEAAVAGKVDALRGLKTDVIIGRLIPAGTGHDARRPAQIGADDLSQRILGWDDGGESARPRAGGGADPGHGARRAGDSRSRGQGRAGGDPAGWEQRAVGKPRTGGRIDAARLCCKLERIAPCA